MILRVVEIKSNDLFTIYDATNGGVCCCSKYTLNQLIKDFGQKIEGVSFLGKKMDIKELSLDGQVRTKKAPVICEDETKRSAVTIMKGLDEKHYPRAKAERRTTGSLVKLTYKSESSKGETIKDALAIQVAQGVFILRNFSVIKKEKHPELKIINYTAATKDEKTHMTTMKSKYEEKMAVLEEKNKLLAEYEKRKIALGKELAELQKQQELTIHTSDTKVHEIDIKVQEIVNDDMYSGITGNELVSYSFMGNKDGPLISAGAVPYLIKRTSRKILYTDGLAYRHPTTYKKLISKAEALDVIKDSWFELDATNTDYIHINTFSGNDMW